MKLLIILALWFPTFSTACSQSVLISGDKGPPPVRFGITALENSLNNTGYQVLGSAVRSSKDSAVFEVEVQPDAKIPAISHEGFKITVAKNKIGIISNDPVGAMYGLLDVAEQLSNGTKLAQIRTSHVNPHFQVRALKFNLPWSSYRTGAVMEQHQQTCKDLEFWRSFLDQMASNRFNVLSLWSVHPFSFMVKPVNFPAANRFSAAEMAAWKKFWTALFRMAKERGIETYVVNWNIAVSPEFAQAYHVKERNDTASIIKRYTREVVAQVINEYPDLTGVGVTLADWMSNFKSAGSTLPEMDARSREQWIADTFIQGIKDSSRPVKFIHRSVLSADPLEMRRTLNNAALKDPALVEIKFNWSHGHSTTTLALTHDSHSGKIDKRYWDPKPTNYNVEWMIRNEDFFILRWGQSTFIREHIRKNSDEFVNGYFVGSEGYIPAKDFSHIPSIHQSWNYAFEKQWLFYQMWGRLLYDPTVPDEIFEKAFDRRYAGGSGKDLLKASLAASKMPLRFASFHAGTWDYTLYSEGFLAPYPANDAGFDAKSAFVSIEELINHPTLDTSYLSIKEYVAMLDNTRDPLNKITPIQLADSLAKDAALVSNIVGRLRGNKNPTLQCELDDLETWAYLSLYFSEKLRAGVSLQTFRVNHVKSFQKNAISNLTRCLEYWKKIAEITSRHYKEVPYVDDQSMERQPDNDAHTFSWLKYIPQAERDIKIAKGEL